MQRRLAICAVTVAVLAAFAVARKYPPVAHAASPTGNLRLISIERAQNGCPLGPMYTFCDQVPATQGLASRVVVEAEAAVSGVTVSFAPILGLASNYAAGDFTIVDDTCAGSLPAGQRCGMDVTFSPTTSGLRAAALTLTDAAGDALAIHLEGTGRNLTLAPPANLPFPVLPTTFPSTGDQYGFPNTPVGTASIAATFTLTAGPAGATGITTAFAVTPGLESQFNAALPDFTIVGTTCTGALAPGASCILSVAFTPTTAGRRSATLVATDSNGESTAIALTGSTDIFYAALLPMSPPNPAPCAQADWAAFCNEPVGGTSTPVIYTIFNSTGSDITGLAIPTGSVTSGVAAPDFRVQSTTCTATLPALTSCQLTVAFTPQQVGLRRGAIAITDAQSDDLTLNLAGVGDDYNLQLSSSQALEVTVAAGGAATFDAQVVPDGLLGLNGEQVTFVCPTNLPANTSCAITPCPASITAATPVSFQITFVTSSATTVAPMPTGGCSGYGPQVKATSLPGAPAGFLGNDRAPRLPLGIIAIAFVLVMAALVARRRVFAGAPPFAGFQRRVGLLRTGKSACATAQYLRRALAWCAAGAFAVAFVAGCGGHGAAKPTPATPASTITMQLQANALDSQGSPLNTSRSLRIILNVTPK